MTPIQVISRPDAHQERIVINDFSAPTAKCATKLMPKEIITASIPPQKKNGIKGMNAPIAVEMPAENAAVHSLGKPCSDNPSTLCAIDCTNCTGCSATRSDIAC